MKMKKYAVNFYYEGEIEKRAYCFAESEEEAIAKAEDALVNYPQLLNDCDKVEVFSLSFVIGQ